MPAAESSTLEAWPKNGLRLQIAIDPDRSVAERSTYHPIRLGIRLLALAAAADFRLGATFRPDL
jgi:hypothetical protein